MALERQTATAPSHWASYLINGDASGLDTLECSQAVRFAEWLGGSIVSCEDAGFCWRHDATRFGALASDCQTYTALVELGAPEFSPEGPWDGGAPDDDAESVS